MRSATTTNVKPFLRWAGGKQWLAHRLARLIPEHNHTYYEPFLGGGSLFFAARPKRAILGDINERLIETYQVLRDRPKDLIPVLSQWENDEKTYYKVRAAEYADNIWRAAQFIYLNKTCWNGLYRVNRQGHFNVPFGYNNRRVFDKTHLLEASEVLQNAKLIYCDFQQLLKMATAGDFVYLDPPYTVLHSRNGFRRYNEKLFSWQDQVRLARTARELAHRGCLVVVSNADNEDVLSLYPDFFHQKVSRHSVLAADPKWRRKTGEALLVSSEQFLLRQV
jgi:DNA adenine methylase